MMFIDEWVDAEILRIKKFRDQYLENSKAHPEQNWPVDMNAGEWDEQYRLYIEE